MSKVLILSTSLRANSNSEVLAHACERGPVKLETTWNLLR